MAASLALAATAVIVPIPARSAAPLTGAIVQVNSDATTQLQNETSIAVNPANPDNLVGGSITFETGQGQCAAYASADGGLTWSHQVLPNAPGVDGAGNPLFNAAGDPAVGFDANGTAYYLCMNLERVPPGTAPATPRTQYLWRSTDGGQTWTGPALAMGTPGTTDDDKGHLAVDDFPLSPNSGNIYAVATRGPCGPAQVRFSRSIDGGLSFQPDQQVNDGGVISFAANVAVGADGAVYVAWRDMTACPPPSGVPAQTTNGILIDKSTDGGQTFGALTGGTDHAVRLGPITQGVRPDPGRGNGNPVLGTHPTNPNIVYATWAENPVGVDDSDIFFARSVDGGNTWGTPLKVNDDVNPVGEFFSQFWPWVAVDPVDGEVDLIWYSDQNDPNRTDGTPLVDAYFASSTDDGVSFGPSLRLTAASSTMGGFFGDYVGIDSFGGVAHPFWVDTTLGGQGDQDVATMQVGGADLRITKADSSDPVFAGDPLTYTLTVTNDGPATATGVVAVDILPAGVAFVSATPSQGSCGFAAPTVTCSLGSLTSGATATVDIEVEPGVAGALSNTAAVAGTNGDPDLSDNGDSETTTVMAKADLATAKSCAPDPVVPGSTITCTVTVTNLGPSPAADVVLTDDLDDRLTLVGPAPGGGGFTCATQGGDPEITCTKATQPVGSASITYTARVSPDVGPEETLTNVATVTTSTAEPTTSNNSATETIATPECTLDFENATQGQRITGTSGPDVICGSFFGDRIEGRGGNDVIFGGYGDDRLYGDSGNDAIFGGYGDDRLYGGDGVDLLFGQQGNDRLNGDSGADVNDGGPGSDSCSSPSSGPGCP